jgi:hypothetical protein
MNNLWYNINAVCQAVIFFIGGILYTHFQGTFIGYFIVGIAGGYCSCFLRFKFFNRYPRRHRSF